MSVARPADHAAVATTGWLSGPARVVTLSAEVAGEVAESSCFVLWTGTGLGSIPPCRETGEAGHRVRERSPSL